MTPHTAASAADSARADRTGLPHAVANPYATRRSKLLVALRYLTPGIVARIYYFAKFGTLISRRAEVPVSEHARWGRGCVISSFTKLKITGPCVFGERVQIATGCMLGASSAGLYIGDDVLIGPNCVIMTGNYAYDRLDVPLQEQDFVPQRTVIGRNVWIGANACVMGGSEIGDNAIVSVGSVVTGRVPPNSVVLGNPAKVIFTRR